MYTTSMEQFDGRKEVKGQREAIVMEVQSLLPGNESDVYVCSVK